MSDVNRDMNRVCMPDDLFKEYAATHPNDHGVTQTQRVFALLLMMREDGVSPLEETYRCGAGCGGAALRSEVWCSNAQRCSWCNTAGREKGRVYRICGVKDVH